MIGINENSSAYLTLRLKDKNGNAAVPSTIQYRVDCLTTGTAVRAWTYASTASIVEIQLDSSDTAIQNDAFKYETKRVTVKANYGGNDDATEEYDFLVKNLAYL